MPLPRAVDLGVDALRLAITASKIGEPHLLLRGDPAVADPESRWEADHAQWRELAAGGLLGDGAVTRQATEALRPLARGRVQYFGWLTMAETAVTFAALVGTRADEATLAERRGDAVRISSVPAERPAESLLATFGEVAPARGRPVSVSTSGGSRDVDRLAEMARVPARATAELYVSVHDGHGRSGTTREPIRFRDTAEGRWAVFTDGTSVTVVPATRRLLATRLYEAYQGLVEPRIVVF
jgi:hypothetical protein